MFLTNRELEINHIVFFVSLFACSFIFFITSTFGYPTMYLVACFIIYLRFCANDSAQIPTLTELILLLFIFGDVSISCYMEDNIHYLFIFVLNVGYYVIYSLTKFKVFKTRENIEIVISNVIFLSFWQIFKIDSLVVLSILLVVFLFRFSYLTQLGSINSPNESLNSECTYWEGNSNINNTDLISSTLENPQYFTEEEFKLIFAKAMTKAKENKGFTNSKEHYFTTEEIQEAWANVLSKMREKE